MGFFGKLKNQVVFQQALELVCIEACEKNDELSPKVLKNIVRLIVSTHKNEDFFVNSLSDNYRDVAFLDIVSFLQAIHKESISSNNMNDANDIFNYLSTILDVAEVPHLKLSFETKQTAKILAAEIGELHVNAQWSNLTR